MNEKEKRAKAHTQIYALIHLVGELRGLAKELTTTEDDCPLRHHKKASHYLLSHIIAGVGFREWDCPFCGEHDMN